MNKSLLWIFLLLATVIPARAFRDMETGAFISRDPIGYILMQPADKWFLDGNQVSQGDYLRALYPGTYADTDPAKSAKTTQGEQQSHVTASVDGNASPGKLSHWHIAEAGQPNIYSYCLDNPWSKFDPEGLDGVFLVGRNKKNPSYFTKKAKAAAAAYEKATGKKAHIFEVRTKKDVQDALATPNIDRLDYLGHGSAQTLFLSEGQNGVITSKDVPNLNTANVQKGANINLLSCYSSNGDKSIAQAFADHFTSNTAGFQGGASFGFSFPPQSENPIITVMPWFPRGNVGVMAPGQTAPIRQGSTVPW